VVFPNAIRKGLMLAFFLWLMNTTPNRRKSASWARQRVSFAGWQVSDNLQNSRRRSLDSNSKDRPQEGCLQGVNQVRKGRGQVLKYLYELCWFRVIPAEDWIKKSWFPNHVRVDGRWFPDQGSGRRTGQTHGSAPTKTMTFGDDPCPV
jgi:hypothetical protein